jgi:hypothetical protein
MFFTKFAAIFCLVALPLAYLADLTLIGIIHITGGLGFFAKTDSANNLFWAAVFFVGWTIAMVIGFSIANRYHMFPLR